MGRSISDPGMTGCSKSTALLSSCGVTPGPKLTTRNTVPLSSVVPTLRPDVSRAAIVVDRKTFARPDHGGARARPALDDVLGDYCGLPFPRHVVAACAYCSCQEMALRASPSSRGIFGCAPKRPLDYSGSAGLLWTVNGGRLLEPHRNSTRPIRSMKHIVVHQHPTGSGY
jgi:hypothetical protein